MINDSDVDKVVYDDADSKQVFNDDEDGNKFNGSNVIEENVMITKVSNFMLVRAEEIDDRDCCEEV